MNYIITNDKTLETSNLYTVDVFSSLVSYIRARGAPYKHKVINLLGLMLHNPEKFLHEKPNFNQLSGIRETIFNYIKTRRKDDKNDKSLTTFLPRRVSELVEMTCYASLAAKFDQKVTYKDIDKNIKPEIIEKYNKEETLSECAESLILLTECIYNQTILNIKNPKLCDIPLNLFIQAHGLCNFKITSERIRDNYKLMREWTSEKDWNLIEYISRSVDHDHMSITPDQIPKEFSYDFKIRYEIISTIPREELMLRYSIILLLNRKLEKVIHMVDLINDINTQTLGHKLSEISNVIFIQTKQQVLQQLIKLTEIERPVHETVIELNNHLAFVSMEKSHRLNKPLDALSSECLFTQV